MQTIRDLIEENIYQHMQYYLDLVHKDGKDAVLYNIRLMDDPNNFVQGTLVNAAALLYVHYKKKSDTRAGKALEQLNQFVCIAGETQLHTWGKLAALRGIVHLQKHGLLQEVNERYLDMLQVRTDYEEFFSKETMSVIGYPSNYMQVAMACTAMRELLGWDSAKLSREILNKILDTVKESSQTGYLDEQPPWGRFDRYSFLVPSEIADNLRSVDAEIPQNVLQQLKNVADVALCMANEKGDGFNYGRSLSCHGDGAALEILASALACHLVDEKDVDKALLYSIRITEKIFEFWYDAELKSFNIWWKGRNTNRYRGEERLLEVNLDMAVHMLSTLHNFEDAGLADRIPELQNLPTPENWKFTKVSFVDSPERKAAVMILRKGDTLSMLPLIGLGNLVKYAAYQPFPAICNVLEAAPEGEAPFLIPEYQMKNGEAYRPSQFYSDICVEENKLIRIIAKGNLTRLLGENKSEKSEYGFTAEYIFEDNMIRVLYDTELDAEFIEMFVGVHGENCKIDVHGFEECVSVSFDPDNFNTPHGALTEGIMYHKHGRGQVSYEVRF